MQKRLSQLISALERISQNVADDPIITDICFDSRRAGTGSLFFALPGTHVNGNEFIRQAVENGVAAVVFQGELPASAMEAAEKRKTDGKECPVFVQVPDARFAMSPVAATFYDYPSQKLVVIGVTGTEGKSSTVSFIWQLLRLCGKKAGFISTVQYSLGDDAIANPEHQTTPEAPIVQRQLYQMVQNGCEYAVVESSSHGLSARTNRLGDVLFDVAVWMNVTHEHLEFHGTHEQYRSDKANLFRYLDRHGHKKTLSGQTATVPSFGVINLEDAAAEYFVAATQKPVYGFTTFGKAGRTNDGAQQKTQHDVVTFAAEHIAATPQGISFTVATPESGTPGTLSIDAPLPGAFNVYNVLASVIAVSNVASIPMTTVATRCSSLKPVKGRMTVVDQGQPFEVIVDYAHTPSSFETIFPPLRKRVKGKLIALFGSGGERDTKKRAEQGRIASEWCDIVVLADEDPRGENPRELLEMIAEGARKAGKIDGSSLLIIPPRQEAIRKAFALAQKDDIVLLLGKAHENSIIYKDFVMPYDEISETTKALAELGYTKKQGE